MIKFNEPQDFENFALENDLVFVSSLADIGIGVFKVRNMNNAEIKIEDLRSKTNVLNIELNLLDPLLNRINFMNYNNNLIQYAMKKIPLKIFGLILISIFIKNSLNAQELDVKTFSQVISPKTSIISKKPIEYQYFFDSVVVRKNQNNENLNVERLGNYLFEYEADKLNLVVNQLAGQERYIVVKGADQAIKFYNGTINVRFSELTNFANFAVQNNLIFVKSLPQINLGVYRVNNIRETETVLQMLARNQIVRGVELDLINPNIGPN